MDPTVLLIQLFCCFNILRTRLRVEDVAFERSMLTQQSTAWWILTHRPRLRRLGTVGIHVRLAQRTQRAQQHRGKQIPSQTVSLLTVAECVLLTHAADTLGSAARRPSRRSRANILTCSGRHERAHAARWARPGPKQNVLSLLTVGNVRAVLTVLADGHIPCFADVHG